MELHVGFQMTRLSEFLLTDIALIRLLPRVDSDMFIKVLSFNKRHLAVGAFEPLVVSG